MFAAMKGRAKIVTLLISSHADLEVQNDAGHKAVYYSFTRNEECANVFVHALKARQEVEAREKAEGQEEAEAREKQLREKAQEAEAGMELLQTQLQQMQLQMQALLLYIITYSYSLSLP